MNSTIEEQLAEKGFYISTTVGVSMRPLLRANRDRVLIKPLKNQRLKKGDLALYRLPIGKYVLHRVIAVNPDHYIIRGDNTYIKEKIPDAWILGVMTEIYRDRRHITAQNKGYRVYVAIWQAIYPLRAFLRRLYLLAARLKNKLFPRKKETDKNT